MDLLNELIELALTKYNELTENQKMETATYIIPEVCTEVHTNRVERGKHFIFIANGRKLSWESFLLYSCPVVGVKCVVH